MQSHYLSGQGLHIAIKPPRQLTKCKPLSAGARHVMALGFKLFAEASHRSRTVTAAWIPEGLDWKGFNGDLKRDGLVVAGGQARLAGRIFRVGHLGSVTVDEIVAAIETLESVSVALFQDYVLPFELASVLLLVAMVGAVVLAKPRI